MFGLSIEEETESGENKSEANRLSGILKDTFNTGSGIVTFEIHLSALEEELKTQLS
jgi:hypothetical protein